MKKLLIIIILLICIVSLTSAAYVPPPKGPHYTSTTASNIFIDELPELSNGECAIVGRIVEKNSYSNYTKYFIELYIKSTDTVKEVEVSPVRFYNKSSDFGTVHRVTVKPAFFHDIIEVEF